MTNDDSTQRRFQAPAGTARHSDGFTLIELLIAVAVIGILAAIAIPNYQGYVEKARRTDAISALTNIAGQLERCYTVTSSYASNASGTACVSFPQDSEEAFYEITAPTLTASTFKLKASPQGPQTKDDCGSFTLNHQGVRSPDGCW